ncbi:fructosamine kinase family protein [Candidatus Laterigemmans baculatus]|uniref:fructosamine kinase family protein n=1 Tax=Candidatus Laterigemmans baculatus TaxID=2770505 RepID=UPI0013D905BF|nr:fructosamine kinase family protein [Candidatus Laterigemmans baculatus]
MLFSPFAIPVVAILGAFTYLVIQAVAQAISQARRHRMDVELKIALAERGMSAAEIERVVTAMPARSGKDFPEPSERATPSSPLPPHKSLPPHQPVPHSHA